MIITILYIIVFTLFTLLAFFGLIIVWLGTVFFDPKRIVVQAYSRFWSYCIYRLDPYWKLKITGLENIDPNQPYLLLSNHQHLLDIPLLLHLPKNFRFVSKQEVYKIPVFGAVLYMRDDVAIERGGAASAKKMIKDCKHYLSTGVSILIFPEGTRTKTGQIGDFHSGAFLLAKRGGVPILPIAINGNYDAFRKRKISKRHTFTVNILPPISTDTIQELTMEELRQHTENLIKQAYHNIPCQN